MAVPSRTRLSYLDRYPSQSGICHQMTVRLVIENPPLTCARSYKTIQAMCALERRRIGSSRAIIAHLHEFTCRLIVHGLRRFVRLW
jgi:hypothetical protein